MRTKCFTNFKLLVENVGPRIYGMLGATMPLGNTILGWRNERSLQLVIAYKLHCMCIDARRLSYQQFSFLDNMVGRVGSSAMWRGNRKCHVLLQTK